MTHKRVVSQGGFFTTHLFPQGIKTVTLNVDKEEEDEETGSVRPTWRFAFAKHVATTVVTSMGIGNFVVETPVSLKAWNFHSILEWNEKRKVRERYSGEEIVTPPKTWVIRYGLNCTVFNKAKSKLAPEMEQILRPFQSLGHIDDPIIRNKAWVTYIQAIDTIIPLAWYASKGKDGGDFGLGMWLNGNEKRRILYGRAMMKNFFWLAEGVGS